MYYEYWLYGWMPVDGGWSPSKRYLRGHGFGAGEEVKQTIANLEAEYGTENVEYKELTAEEYKARYAKVS